MRFFQFFILMLLVLFLSTTLAICDEGDEDSVTVVIRRKDAGPFMIENLTFDVLSARLVSRPDGLQDVYVIARMVFTGPINWQVRTTMKPTSLRPNEPFLLAAKFNVPIVNFILTAVGPNGEQINENFVVVSVRKKKRSKFQSDIFLGVSQTKYKEELRTEIKQTSWTAGMNLTYFLKRPTWSIKGDAFSDVAIIESNAKTYSSKFLMVGGQFDYAFPPLSSVKASIVSAREFNQAHIWKFKLSLGLFSPVMFDKQGDFGYSPLLIPRLYPSITKCVGKRDIYGYFRYMPLGKAGTVDSGFGLGTILNTSDYRRWIFAIDYSYLQIKPKPKHTIKMNSLGLRVGYGF